MSNEDQNYQWTITELRKLDNLLQRVENRANDSYDRATALQIKLDKLEDKVEEIERAVHNNSRLIIEPPKRIDWKAIGVLIGAIAATIAAMLGGF